MTGSSLRVEFVGEVYELDPDATFTIGREADLVIDDANPFLHRHFLTLRHENGLWWLVNAGATLTATISDPDGAMQAWLAPGAALPIVFATTTVWFTAGATTYDFTIVAPDAAFAPVPAPLAQPDGSLTLGRVTLTPDQKLLLVALAESVLRRGDRGAGTIPPTAAAASRLGWPVTKFNRKLDNVCAKLSTLGVRGLHGGPSALASGRRARLVEYAVASRLVTPDDLALLPGQPAGA
ncbi:FHA domain-containing protein [Nigerium massiliense]|uniref:hypothetical protein n=1 Tax=Nigerium massiliense TaxID=1522317 RepID=UPI00058DF9F7|nr:hypothetical protein [Nigerium massiliense]